MSGLDSDLQGKAERPGFDMTTRSIHTKLSDVHGQASRAIQERPGAARDGDAHILAFWMEPDGSVVLHLDSAENAAVVMHALWRRYEVNGDLHPEYGVLVWVA